MSSRGVNVFSVMFPFAVATGIAAGDNYIKNKMEDELSEEGKEIKKGCLKFRKLHNKGAIFGIGQEYEEEMKGVSAFGTVLTFFALMFSMTKKGRLFEKAGLSLILGGAASNTYDRFQKGYVRDYVSLDVKNNKIKKLVFNLSDISIFLGAILVMISNLNSKDRVI